MKPTQSIQQHVANHKVTIQNQLDILHAKLDEVVEFSYAGDIVSTLRILDELKYESYKLSELIEILLISIEQENFA